MLAFSLTFIEVHGPDGQRAYVNPREITSLRSPIPTDLKKHFPPRTHCVIFTTNGKFLATTETCDQIRTKLESLHE